MCIIKEKYYSSGIEPMFSTVILYTTFLFINNLIQWIRIRHDHIPSQLYIFTQHLSWT